MAAPSVDDLARSFERHPRAANKSPRTVEAYLEASGSSPPTSTPTGGPTAIVACPTVTGGPYAETQEVLAGFWIVECESFDRATEIAARLATCPAPDLVAASAVADVRPIADSQADLEL